MKNNILKILSTAKSMKAFCYHYDPISRCLLGCDEKMNHLRVVELPELEFTKPLFFYNKAIKELNEKLTITGFKDVEDGYYLTFSDNERYCMFNPATETMKYLYDKVRGYISSNERKFSYDELRGNEQFEQALSLKSKEGSVMFKIDYQYMLSLFSGLLPVNKSDKVSLNIYSNDRDFAFLAHFRITKSKSVVINVFINYIKMI